MPGFFGNSENVEFFLVGGKGKLQEIGRELGSDYSAGSSAETKLKDIHGLVLSGGHSTPLESNKLLKLWAVDIYEENFGDSSLDVESSKGNQGSTDKQEVNRPN